MKKVFTGIFSVLILTIFLNAQDFQIAGFTGINSVFQYGSIDDYVAGENDFPVTPAHKIPVIGLSLSYYLSEKIGVELTGMYNFTTKIKLEDPSDGDSVEINSSENYSFLLEIYYEKTMGKIISYISIGGGINKIMGHEETVLSEYGWEIEFLPPERTVDPVFSLGAGVKYKIIDYIGLKAGIRYNLIFTQATNISNLLLFGGLLISF